MLAKPVLHYFDQWSRISAGCILKFPAMPSHDNLLPKISINHHCDCGRWSCSFLQLRSAAAPFRRNKLNMTRWRVDQIRHAARSTSRRLASSIQPTPTFPMRPNSILLLVYCWVRVNQLLIVINKTSLVASTIGQLELVFNLTLISWKSQTLTD